ncbi:MAG: hypothetical protein H0U74_01470 [Bradymonadaceae bacterium]|nr:hypothetical protein [Lujinxingiaceae bacterium]
MKNLYRISSLSFALMMIFSLGCGTVKVTNDDDTRSGQHALTAEQCEESCKADFHECKDSPDKGGGPGASACAHEKNSCEKKCK